MIEQEILSALQTAAIAAVNASTLSTLPIKAISRTFNIPDDQRYVELIRIPNNVLNEFWGNEKTYRGLFRLILHWPVDDQGAYAPLSVLQSIVSYFQIHNSFVSSGVTVKILENPDFLGELETGKEVLYPVSIRYQCFKP